VAKVVKVLAKMRTGLCIVRYVTHNTTIMHYIFKKYIRNKIFASQMKSYIFWFPHKAILLCIFFVELAWGKILQVFCAHNSPLKFLKVFNPSNPELNPICYLLALLGAHHFLHVCRIRVKIINL